jgi:pimeloyl-ACP methyl ester carboxylesterase
MMVDQTPPASQAGSGLIELCGAQLELVTRGSGRPILFLHPELGLSPELAVLDILADLGKVYAPSHPGFMRSSLPPHFSNIDDLAYFYLEMLDTLSLRDVLVVGVSFGAWIAAEMAIKSCEHISSLILASPMGIKVGDREEAHVVDRFSMTAEQFNILAYADPALAGDVSDLSDEDAEIYARNQDAHALFGWLPYMIDPKLRHLLHRIKSPTLVIKGERDRIISDRYANEFVELIPGAKFVSLPGSGHYPHIERPREFVAKIDAFAGRG